MLRSLATLAYDCRRGEMFRAELMDALRIIDRGDLTPEEMIGSWAGELGQTQFLPSHYLKHAVDFDGDGRRNLMTSVPDVIASTANFLVQLGWQTRPAVAAGGAGAGQSRRGTRPTSPFSIRAPNGRAGA